MVKCLADLLLYFFCLGENHLTLTDTPALGHVEEGPYENPLKRSAKVVAHPAPR